MNERLYLAAPLEIEGWEVVECLDSHTLFEEFAERVDDALSLLHEGQSHWREHQTADGEWSAPAGDAVGEVRRLAYNIRQSFQRYGGDLAACIRSSIGNSGEAGISDAQYVAALAMDRACRVIEALASWLSDFDGVLYSVRPDLVELIAENDPDGFADLLSRRRAECAQGEMDTRESVAELLGEARRYIVIADAYACPVLGDIERYRRGAAAKKGGIGSVETRRNKIQDSGRNTAICEAARRLLNSGCAEREVVGKILGTGAALGLGAKMIRNILQTEGILEKKTAKTRK